MCCEWAIVLLSQTGHSRKRPCGTGALSRLCPTQQGTFVKVSVCTRLSAQHPPVPQQLDWCLSSQRRNKVWIVRGRKHVWVRAGSAPCQRFPQVLHVRLRGQQLLARNALCVRSAWHTSKAWKRNKMHKGGVVLWKIEEETSCCEDIWNNPNTFAIKQPRAFSHIGLYVISLFCLHNSQSLTIFNKAHCIHTLYCCCCADRKM